MKPTLLICDNFTSSLDMVMKERLLSIVSKELGKVLIGNMQNTIVVIPESVKIATSCDWVVYLSRGIIKEQGNPKDLIARDQGFAKLVKSGTRFHYMFLDRPQKQKSLK
jgi:ABC-type multidrug transport system fused ATPase/permease subunit